MHYSVLERPPPDSDLVKEALTVVNLLIDMAEMPDDMILIAKFLQLAELGLASHLILQGKVKHSQIEILLLTDQSIVAMSDFARVCRRVLDDFESAYNYLYNGYIEMATLKYTSVSDDAKKMTEKAKELQHQFQKEMDQLQLLLSETFDAKSKAKNDKSQTSEKKKRLMANIKKLKTRKDEANKKYDEMLIAFRDAKEKEEKYLSYINSSFFTRLVDGFTYKIAGFHAFNTDKEELYIQSAASYSQAKDKYFEKKEKARNTKSEVIAEIAALTQEIKNAKNKEELADIVTEALQGVIEEFYQVISALANAVKFWNEFTVHLESLQKGDDLKNAINIINQDERDQVLHSNRFKINAVRNYAYWIATYNITSQFKYQMKPARKALSDAVKGKPVNDKRLPKGTRRIAEEL